MGRVIFMAIMQVNGIGHAMFVRLVEQILCPYWGLGGVFWPFAVVHLLALADK